MRSFLLVLFAVAFSGVNAQIEITTAEQFKNLDLNGNYKLMADIDLTRGSVVPIGGRYSYFNGTFDGNGHTIRISSISDDYDYRGLFSRIGTEGVIKNLKVTGNMDNSMSVISRVGGIAGRNDGTITNCFSSVSVNCGRVQNNQPRSQTGGGIAGVNSGTISYCVAAGDITGASNSSGIGGIVGMNYSNNSGKIENCIYGGDEIYNPNNSSNSYYGMICGDVHDDSWANNVTNCFYKANDALTGLGSPGGTVADGSRCTPLTQDEFRALLSEGGIYASTEYDVFRNLILMAVAPYSYTNFDTKETAGFATFYNGDCNYVSDNSVTIYTGIVKGSNLYLFEMDGHIIPKGVPVILKNEYRYFSLYKSYKECTFNGRNDLKGTDNDLSCSASSNFILGINSGSSAFILNNNTKVSANTAYLPNQEEIEDYDFLSIKIIEPSPAISFVDDNVKAICVANWDFNGDGELNEGEAAIVTDLGQVFKGNTNITSFDELRYFTGLTSIGYQAFHGCSGLTSVTIGNGVTSIGYQAFYNCNGLTSIHVEEGNPKYDSRDNCNAIIETATNKLIKGCKNSTIPNTVTEIGDGAFQNCNNLTSINIPNSVTRIGCESFFGCNDLMSIIIGTGVTSIADNTFTGCNSLTSVTINSDYIMSRTTFGSSDNMKTIFGDQVTTYIIGDDVTSIGRVAFCGCTNLTSVTIGNSVISIGGSAFYDCSNLTSVIISNSVESIASDAFHGCINLNSVTIPGSVKTIEEFAFYGCLSLTSLSIEDGVSSIGIAAFKRCGYSSLTIPNSVTSIGQSAFRETPWYDNQPDGLIYTGRVAYEYKGTMPDNTSVTIKEGTKHISTLAFNDCGGLVSITIPNSVTSIGQFAFSGCRGLTSVVSMIEEPFINEDEDIFNRYNVNSTCTLTVPVGTRDAYIAAGWTEDVFKGGIVELDNRQEQTMELISLPTMTYGDESNTLPVNTQEGLALTWTSDAANVATISGNILTVKGVGTATITATQEGDNGYKPFSKEFTLTVDKAPLTITAKNYTIKQGEALPTFAVEYSGFKNNETEEVLTKKPSITCIATSNSAVGTYEITVSGAEAENYEISHVVGTLTITEDEQALNNTLAITNAEVCKGRQITLPVNMNNTESITAIQFDLTLPAGVSIAKNNQGKYIVEKTERCAEHTLSVSKPGEANVYKVLLYILPVENITGNEGSVVNVTLDTSGEMTEGEYEVLISNINLTTSDEKKITPADVTCKLTVHGSIPGDANADGVVDVTDVVAIANSILGRPSSSFDAAAADVNGDSSVDVTDIVVVANMILRGNGQNNAKMRGGDEDDEEEILDPQ